MHSAGRGQHFVGPQRGCRSDPCADSAGFREILDPHDISTDGEIVVRGGDSRTVDRHQPVELSQQQADVVNAGFVERSIERGFDHRRGYPAEDVEVPLQTTEDEKVALAEHFLDFDEYVRLWNGFQ
jgi:hypothetical protein